MTHMQAYYANVAQTVMKSFEKRQIESYYCEDSAAAVQKALELIPAGSSIAWGGSETIKQCGLMAALRAEPKYTLIDRDTAKTPEEKSAMFARICCADFFLMSTNAFTLDGHLVNIDGLGNRVAPLCYGPKNVLIVTGMNKLTKNVEDGLNRVHLVAAPPNGVRLNRKTPCALTGKCGDCLAPDCLCNQVVVTRHCGQPGRIKVIMVGETLGF